MASHRTQEDSDHFAQMLNCATPLNYVFISTDGEAKHQQSNPSVKRGWLAACPACLGQDLFTPSTPALQRCTVYMTTAPCLKMTAAAAIRVHLLSCMCSRMALGAHKQQPGPWVWAVHAMEKLRSTSVLILQTSQDGKILPLRCLSCLTSKEQRNRAFFFFPIRSHFYFKTTLRTYSESTLRLC